MKDFIAGFQYAFEGFKLIKEKSVRRYVLIPLAINILIFSLGIAYAAHEFSGFMDIVPDMFPEKLDLPKWLMWIDSGYQWFLGLFGWVEYLLWSLFGMLFLVIVFYTFTLLANLISAPFNGFFSAAVERNLLGQDCELEHVDRSLSQEAMVAIAGEGRKLLYLAKCLPLLLIGVLILFFLPLFNGLIPVVWFLFGAWMLSINYSDYPMGNHGLVFNQEKAILKQNRRLAIGFGSSLMLMTMIPVLNFFAVPVGVAGATKLFHDRLRDPVNDCKRLAQAKA